MPRTILNDELWAKLSAILRQNGLYAKQSTRLNIEGILFRMRTGCPWRDLPAVFGKRNTVYCAFNRWSAKGIPQLIQKTCGLRMAVHGRQLRQGASACPWGGQWR